MEIVTFEPVSEKDGTLRAVLHGEIDHHTARPMRDLIDRHIVAGKPNTLILSFRDVPFMDSSGIGLILGRAETMRHFDGKLVVSGLSGELSRVVRLCGIEKIPNITLQL